MKRRIYSEKIRKEALDLADKIGAKKAAEELGVNVNTLRSWISRDNGETTAAANAAAAVSLTAATMMVEENQPEGRTSDPDRAAPSYHKYKKAFKKKALRKSDAAMKRHKNGVRRTAIELGMNYSTLAGWRCHRPKDSRGPQGRPVIKMADSFPEKDLRIMELEGELEARRLMVSIQADLNDIRADLNEILGLRESLVDFTEDLENVAREKGLITETPDIRGKSVTV